jgi:mannonate dehydratase
VKMTFRWFGPDDPVRLEHIRQIPGVTGIVSALYEIAPGDPWPLESLERLGERIDTTGLDFAVVESIPVHEDIKLGKPSRDRLIENYCASIRNVGAAGIPVVVYNFMPIFDWTRTSLDMLLPDGSTTLAFSDGELSRIDLSRGAAELPGWATSYTPARLGALLTAYRELDSEKLWENLSYFLERVVPVAAEAGVKMAIHPDDPPWSIFGLPRIITDKAALARLVELVDNEANGITFCTGSLGSLPENDLPAMIRQLATRIHFAHCRNVRITGTRAFHETPHPSRFGNVDMRAVLLALRESGFDGPMRPDHGRMIWSETGRPGYGLHDRALGAMYLQGLWEGLGGAG